MGFPLALATFCIRFIMPYEIPLRHSSLLCLLHHFRTKFFHSQDSSNHVSRFTSLFFSNPHVQHMPYRCLPIPFQSHARRKTLRLSFFDQMHHVPHPLVSQVLQTNLSFSPLVLLEEVMPTSSLNTYLPLRNNPPP